MLKPSDLHEYQRRAIIHQLQNDDSMLWLGMGLGKTIITLTTVVDRMRAGVLKKTVVFAPLRVIKSVWAQESVKWEHTKRLRFSLVHGSKVKRLDALFAPADVYLINYEAANWFAETLEKYFLSQGKELPFQMVVYDEVSRLKNSTSLRVAGGKRDRVDKHGTEHTVRVVGWRRVLDMFKYRTGLTGTPAGNGYPDLHGQYLVVDGGKRLGTHVTHFRSSYLTKGYDGWSYSITDEAKARLESKIRDITLNMNSEDYIDMPKTNVIDIMVDMPNKARKHYEEIEREMMTMLDEGMSIEVFSQSAVSNKLLQVANGSPYLEAGKLEHVAIHDAKLEALSSVIEEAAGSPIFCSYSFKSDAERIMKKFRKIKPVNLTTVRNIGQTLKNWKAGKIRLLIGHPASVGHGIDGLQDMGNIVVFFGLNWSLELCEQFVGRIKRQGQKKAVTVVRILCKKTVDERIRDRLEDKKTEQEDLKGRMVSFI